MRHLALLGIAFVAAGCEWNPWMLDYQSTMHQETRGVVFRGDGSGAQVGMMGTTCAVNPRTGSPSTDYDYPGTEDTVQDSKVTPSGETVVIVTSEQGVHIQRDHAWWGATSDDYDLDDVLEARALDDGAIVLTGDDNACSVEWVGDRTAALALDADLCHNIDGFTGDPTAGTGYIGTSEGIYVVTPEVATPLDPEPAELVHWDPVAEVLYAAERDGTLVRALEADGTERWATDVGTSVISLDDMGVREAVAVGLAYDDGSGGAIVLDAHTGEELASLTSPESVNEVRAGGDGNNLALVQDHQVHFYSVGASSSSSSWDTGDWGTGGGSWDWDMGSAGW